MAKKSEYNCILYEPGDKIVDKHSGGKVHTVEATDIRNVGIYPCQFLKFVDEPINITDISNLFVPAEETIEKYKDGLKYLNEVKIRVNKVGIGGQASKAGAKVHSLLARQLKRDNTLTEEDLKPRVMSKGSFSARPPIEKKDE